MRTVLREKIQKLNIWQILEQLRRKYWVVLLSTLVCGLTVFLVTTFALPHYYESAAYFVMGSPVYKAGRMPTTEERHLFEAYVADYDQLLRTDVAIEEMMAYTDPETDPETLMEMIYLEPVLLESQIRVAVRGEDPKEVGRLAEKIGRLLPELSEEEPVYRKYVDGTPENPVFPKIARDTVSALIFGFVFGASLAVLNMMFPSVRRKSKAAPVQRDLPVLASVPQASREELELEKQRRRACTTPVGSARQTAYQTLGSKISALLKEKRACMVVGITSLVAGEGKTDTAVQLARILARSGRKVLVVDGNLRRPGVHKKVSLMARPGLTEVLSGKTALEEAVRMVNASDLPFYVLRAGALPKDPRKVLSGQNLQILMLQLRSSYDCILLDLPAVKDASDVKDVAALVDHYILVVREGNFGRNPMEKALGKLEAVRGSVAGVVMTDVAE